jgi:hypothetical protein
MLLCVLPTVPPVVQANVIPHSPVYSTLPGLPSPMGPATSNQGFFEVTGCVLDPSNPTQCIPGWTLQGTPSVDGTATCTSQASTGPNSVSFKCYPTAMAGGGTCQFQMIFKTSSPNEQPVVSNIMTGQGKHCLVTTSQLSCRSGHGQLLVSCILSKGVAGMLFCRGDV